MPQEREMNMELRVERLEAENAALRKHCADLNNFLRHDFWEQATTAIGELEKARDKLFNMAQWPRRAGGAERNAS